MRNSVVGKILILSLLCVTSVKAQWTHEMDSLARITESCYGLPHGICRAFAVQESNCNPKATRVETGYFNQGSSYYKRVMQTADAFSATHKWSDPVTERAYESISFGCWQIMGSNLRAMGYDAVRMSTILNDLPTQFKYFALFVQPLWRRYKNLARVAAAYNTGNPNRTGRGYDRNIVKYQQKYAY